MGLPCRSHGDVASGYSVAMLAMWSALIMGKPSLLPQSHFTILTLCQTLATIILCSCLTATWLLPTAIILVALCLVILRLRTKKGMLVLLLHQRLPYRLCQADSHQPARQEDIHSSHRVRLHQRADIPHQLQADNGPDTPPMALPKYKFN